MPLLEVKDIDVSYGDVRAVSGLSLHLDEREIVTLLGNNGAGKSTTIKAISGLVRPRRGEILLAGQSLSALMPHEVARKGVVQVPEGRRLFPELTVLDNLMLGGLRQSPQAVRETLEYVYQLMPPVYEKRQALARDLSGGQQQMVAIGRALMAKPRVLMLDEPSLGLAPKVVMQLFDLIGAIHQRGATILLVEQNAHMALEIANRAYIIENGSLVTEGQAAVLAKSDEVRRAYLGFVEGS